MRFSLRLIVEGQGDVNAAPVLLRRLVPRIAPDFSFEISRPIRVGKTKLLRPGELERTVELASRQLQGHGAILILIDADDDCPGVHGPELLARAQAAHPGLPIRTVLANREFETWFVAAARSLRGHRGLPFDLDTPERPEQIRGAKEWLSTRMEGRRYRATLDQPAFAGLIDLDEARQVSSFTYLVEKLQELVAELKSTPPPPARD